MNGKITTQWKPSSPSWASSATAKLRLITTSEVPTEMGMSCFGIGSSGLSSRRRRRGTWSRSGRRDRQRAPAGTLGTFVRTVAGRSCLCAGGGGPRSASAYWSETSSGLLATIVLASIAPTPARACPTAAAAARDPHDQQAARGGAMHGLIGRMHRGRNGEDRTAPGFGRPGYNGSCSWRRFDLDVERGVRQTGTGSSQQGQRSPMPREPD